MPVFVSLGLYYMNVSEEAPVGTTVGKVCAEDSDIGENAAMNYSIEGHDSDVFDIITNNETQEGIILLKKVRPQRPSKKISKYWKEDLQASWMFHKRLLLWILLSSLSSGFVI